MSEPRVLPAKCQTDCVIFKGKYLGISPEKKILRYMSNGLFTVLLILLTSAPIGAWK